MAPYARLPLPFQRHSAGHPGRRPDPSPHLRSTPELPHRSHALRHRGRRHRRGPRAREKTLALARRACSGCPIVTDCLKWALANPGLPPTGVWAATTKRERTRLRNQLAARLGLRLGRRRRRTGPPPARTAARRPPRPAARPRPGPGPAGTGAHPDPARAV
ncbi:MULTISPECIES: WhiB family transcriptional regulator [unclassified Streptomyces]|uniref:WhiB family transcriptional regulator n=1 Tax=unclassified Streptomyces TaxID=2593676 RepID=UPI002E2AD5E4|nr:WhiB family transcriptional regulator [Streptomyces sp. NBC_01423]WSX89032.1 WhiB family transcriptional regulator [Streptomyces sp. NBC_00891]WSY03511.1 WhiB family transcriptional regulator [Streptomyces sp. NBC_00890]WSZ05138.1 WhiB family transcriptional regulator [Streptomyces sp. NBC_00869]WSZ21240.1 WhiB family transcriptional regulator [Streptomyces sp. NBC_00870]WSX95155.1 WhiB family transcriptional regulator [Streptomyces sp. NBC_00891]